MVDIVFLLIEKDLFMLHSLFCQSQSSPWLSFFKLKFNFKKIIQKHWSLALKSSYNFTSNSNGILLFFPLSFPRIVAKASKNLMSSQSLGIVFGPTLLRAENETGNMAVHMVYQNQIAELMLSEYKKIFGSEADWQTRQVPEYVHICLGA